MSSLPLQRLSQPISWLAIFIRRRAEAKPEHPGDEISPTIDSLRHEFLVLLAAS